MILDFVSQQNVRKAILTVIAKVTKAISEQQLLAIIATVDSVATTDSAQGNRFALTTVLFTLLLLLRLTTTLGEPDALDASKQATVAGEGLIVANDVIAPLGGILSSDDSADFRLYALQIIEYVSTFLL
jgi:hypothetical protein